MRPRPRLRVVLDAESGDVAAGEALDDLVVQVDMGDRWRRRPTRRRPRSRGSGSSPRRPRRQAPHRMVAAVVAKGELVGLPPSAAPSSWWPRQTPKTGTSPRNQPDLGDEVAERRRVAGAVGEEHAVGPRARTSAGVPAGTTSTVATASCEDRPLDAEVVGDDPSGPPQPRRRSAWSPRRRGPGPRSRVRQRRRQQPPGGGAEGAGHRPRLAHVAGEPPGVDGGQPADAVAARYASRPRRAPAARAARQVADDDPRQYGRRDSSSGAVTP